MASFPCPSCGRALALPDAVRGQWVQCPACRESFSAPRDDGPAPAAGPAPPGPASAGAASAGAAAEFDFREEREREESGLGARLEAGLHSAAFWLQAAGLLAVVANTVSCCSPSAGPELFGLLAAGVAFFEFVPMVLMLIGSWLMSRRQSRGLAVTGGVMAFAVSLCSLVVAVRDALGGVALLRRLELVGLIALGGALLSLLAAGAAAVGGVKTLAVLSSPKVKSAFR